MVYNNNVTFSDGQGRYNIKEDFVMKKLILLVSMIMALAFGTVAFAAGDGTALNTEQKAAEKLLTAMTNSTATVTSVKGIFTPGLEKKIDATALTNLQKTITEKFGTAKGEASFRVFERADKADVLLYQMSFSKVNLVNFQFVFTKGGEKVLIDSFSFGPVQAPAQAPANK